MNIMFYIPVRGPEDNLGIYKMNVLQVGRMKTFVIKTLHHTVYTCTTTRSDLPSISHYSVSPNDHLHNEHTRMRIHIMDVTVTK